MILKSVPLEIAMILILRLYSNTLSVRGSNKASRVILIY